MQLNDAAELGRTPLELYGLSDWTLVFDWANVVPESAGRGTNRSACLRR